VETKDEKWKEINYLILWTASNGDHPCTHVNENRKLTIGVSERQIRG